MAFITENTATGDGSETEFSFTFPYINESDVRVTITDANGDPQSNTAFTFANATTLSFTTAPPDGRTVRIFRDTNLDNAVVSYFAGSAIRAEDLNDNQNQVLYSAQEVENNVVLTTGGTMTQPLTLDDTELKITEGDDTLTLDVPALTDDHTISFPNVSGTVVTTGDTDTVTSDMLTNNIDIAGTLDVTAATTLDNNLSVGGTSTFTGTITANGSIDLAGDIDVDGTANLDNVDIDGTVHVQSTSEFVGEITATGGVSGDLSGTATNATHVTVTDNENTNENNLIPFIEDASATGDVGLESDGDFHYNPSTGTVTATTFSGALSGTASFATDLAAGAKVTDTEAKANGFATSESTYFTTAASDERYFNISSGDTIKDGQAFPDNDTTIATTAAINDRIIDLVDDVGGFVPIANETSFPAANPDVNNGAGTIVSIASIGTSRTPTNGTVTIANGQGSNTVTITNCGTTVLAQGFGCLLETTTTLNTYTFHRLTPLATEVTTVAGNNANITTVATNIDDIVTVANDLNEGTSEIETVANAIANVNAVGDDIANVNTVAGSIADVNNFADVYQINNGDPTQRADGTALVEGDLVYRSDTDVIRVFNGTSYSDITPDQATINDITIVADDLASFEDLGSIADALVANQSGGALETCADNISDIQTVENISANVTTVAGISANVTTVAGVSANVTTVANSIDDVNRYANEYLIQSSAPSNPSTGDLWYDSSANANVLKYYNGTIWASISAGISDIVSDTTPELGGHLDCNDKNLTEVGTVSGDNLQIDFGGLT